jgi:hypothetical protein
VRITVVPCVHRGYVFVYVARATGLTEDERDEAVDVLTAFRALLRDVCARRRVRIAKWLRDGVVGFVRPTIAEGLAGIISINKCRNRKRSA